MLNEADTCRIYITPALQAAGWGVPGERKKAGEISHTKTAAVMQIYEMFDCEQSVHFVSPPLFFALLLGLISFTTESPIDF